MKCCPEHALELLLQSEETVQDADPGALSRKTESEPVAGEPAGGAE